MIILDNKNINDMEEAYEFLKDKYSEKDWDIWKNYMSFGIVIFVEDKYNAINNSIILHNLDEVTLFVNNGGFD